MHLKVVQVRVHVFVTQKNFQHKLVGGDTGDIDIFRLQFRPKLTIPRERYVFADINTIQYHFLTQTWTRTRHGTKFNFFHLVSRPVCLRMNSLAVNDDVRKSLKPA